MCRIPNIGFASAWLFPMITSLLSSEKGVVSNHALLIASEKARLDRGLRYSSLKIAAYRTRDPNKDINDKK